MNKPAAGGTGIVVSPETRTVWSCPHTQIVATSAALPPAKVTGVCGCDLSRTSSLVVPRVATDRNGRTTQRHTLQQER